MNVPIWVPFRHLHHAMVRGFAELILLPQSLHCGVRSMKMQPKLGHLRISGASLSVTFWPPSASSKGFEALPKRSSWMF